MPAESLRLGDRDALNPDLVEGFLHFVELERFNDRFNLFHRLTQMTKFNQEAFAAGYQFDCTARATTLSRGIARRVPAVALPDMVSTLPSPRQGCHSFLHGTASYTSRAPIL